MSLCHVIWFSKVCFSLTFYRWILVFFPWNLVWNSFYTTENPNLLVSSQQIKVSFGLTCFHCKCLKGNQSVALRKMGCLFISAKMMLSVLHKELECKVEKLGGHAAKDQKYIWTSSWWINHPGAVHMEFNSCDWSIQSIIH